MSVNQDNVLRSPDPSANGNGDDTDPGTRDASFQYFTVSLVFSFVFPIEFSLFKLFSLLWV